jgi:hypothetical protein
MLTAVSLAALVLLLGSLRMAPGVVGAYHDDAIYVSTAKALAQGEGYRLVNIPGSPRQTMYPVLYPALLAVVWKVRPVFPENLILMQWISVAAGALAVGLAYLYLVRFGYATRLVATASGLLCATTPLLLYLSTLTLSEMPFALLVVCALWALESQAVRESPFRQFTRGVVLALPFLCRTVGGALVPCGLFVLWRTNRPVAWTAVGAGVAVAPWILWSMGAWGGWHQDAVAGYYTDYWGLWHGYGVGRLPQILQINGLWIIHSVAGLVFSGLGWVITRSGFPSWIPMFLLGLAAFPSLVSGLRRLRLMHWCLLGYLVVVWLWPWSPSRFLVPVLPLVIPALLEGLSKLFPPLWRSQAASAALAVALAANLWALQRDRDVVRLTGYPHDGTTHQPASWESHLDAFHWLVSHSEPTDIVASEIDTMVYLYTGLRSFRPLVSNPMAVSYGDTAGAVASPAQLYRALDKVRPRYLLHLVPVQEADAPPHPLELLMAGYPDLLSLVYETQDRRFAIFALNHPEPAVNSRSRVR